MNNNLINDLPEIFNPYKEKIIQSQRPRIKMSLSPAKNLPLWQSKVGGVPYLPLTTDYPKNDEGERLQLLAQFNFSELPENEMYPKMGILQFYIDANDDLYGMSFDDQTDQSKFRVLFHDTVLTDPTQLHSFDIPELNKEFESSPLPLDSEYAIRFENSAQYISLADWQFAPLILGVDELHEFAEKFEGGDFYDDFYEEYADVLSSSGHHLGGYPFFTQSDPRYTPELQEYILLFQLDTDGQNGVDIMWGDAGVGNFFIRPVDLKNKDFSKVLYNWDCS